VLARSDGIIRIINVADRTECEVLRAGESAPQVRCLAFDPKEEFLASASADGKVAIWDLEDKKVGPVSHDPPTCPNPDPVSHLSVLLKVIGTMEGSKPDADASLHMSWHPKGKHLAVPMGNMAKIFIRDAWTEAYSLDGGHEGDVTTAVFSPNGKYIATAGADSKVVVWDTTKREALAGVSRQLESAATELSWHPTDNSLTIANGDGFLQLWEKIIPHDNAHPSDPEAVIEGPKKIRNDLIDDEAYAEGEAEDAVGGESDIDDWLVDDDGDGGEYRKELLEEKEKEKERLANGPILAAQEALKAEARQPSFQPGASSLGLKRRFLAWNMTGFLVSRDETTHHTIDIEFADTTRGRPPSIRDHHNFELGTLDPHGALFAARADGENKAMVMYTPFNSQFANSQWSIELPEGEEPVAVACSRKWCAAATTKGLLRVFSAQGGLQKHLFSRQGPIVSMVAHGDRLAVISHGMQPLAGMGQNLELEVYDMERTQVITRHEVCLSEGSVLQWAGFATTGMLCTMDAAGMLRGLSEKQGWQWVPLLDMVPLRKTKEDAHWIVGITEEDVMCVLLKQGATEPHVHPRPLLESVQIDVPLLENDPEFAPLERSAFRRKLVIECEKLEHESTGVDTGVEEAQGGAMDRELLQMLNMAMKAEKEARALEIGCQFNQARSMQMAIKLAEVSQMPTLAERLTLIAQAKFAKKEELPSRKRTREVQFQDEAEEEEPEETEEQQGAEEEEEEGTEEGAAMEEEDDASHVPERTALSPVPPQSRGSPLKRARAESSSPLEEEGTTTEGNNESAERPTASQNRALFSEAGQGFGNPFAKSLTGAKASASGAGKSLAGSLSSMGGMKAHTTATAGVGGSKFGAGQKTKRPIGKAAGRAK